MAIDKSLFGRLKRLFSTDVVIRNVGGNQLRVIDVDKIQSLGVIQTNSLIDRFTKLYSTTGTGIFNLNNVLNYQTLRIQLYSDYETMDTDAIIASTLDIISDECTLKNEAGEILQIRSSDDDIQKILYNLFYDVLNIDFNLWSWTRNMCKYGDFYLKLEIAEKFGVYNVIPFSAYNIIREEGTDPENPSRVRFRYDRTGLSGGTPGYSPVISSVLSSEGDQIAFENYEMAHFRLIADSNFLPYGRSYIEPARKLWKQLVLMEDAMLIHRIVRAPEKRTFFINVGSIPPNEVDAFMQKTMNTMKKVPYLDPESGQYNLKFNLQNMMEDFYIPVRGNDSTTKIDYAKGLEYNAIEDVTYLRDKVFAALKVPKAFLGYEKDLSGKSTLAAEDIRFARTIERIQRIIVSELRKIALVHLYVQGYEGESLTNFELSLTTPSIIYDQERIALLQEKVDLAAQMMDNNIMPTDWIYDNLFHFSEDQYDELRDLLIEDKKRKFRLDQIENEGNDPFASGESYGTPHDLASLYGKGRYPGASEDLPSGYDENEQGRPKEKASFFNTQRDPLSKDRSGAKGMTDSDEKIEKPKSIKDMFKGGSPVMAYENSDMLKNLKAKNFHKKKIIFERASGSMLDESNLKFEENSLIEGLAKEKEKNFQNLGKNKYSLKKPTKSTKPSMLDESNLKDE